MDFERVLLAFKTIPAVQGGKIKAYQTSLGFFDLANAAPL
jgi:hypothetical protein